MTRKDFYFGNQNDLDLALYAGLVNSSTDGAAISLDDFAKYQSVRQNHSNQFNPTYTFGPTQQV